MCETKVAEKIKTYILFSINSFRIPCRLRENMEKHGKARQATDDNKIRRARKAFCVTKAKDVHSEYVILFSHGNNSYANAPECNVYTYIACPVIFVIFCLSLGTQSCW
jgi:hypothetical protein